MFVFICSLRLVHIILQWSLSFFLTKLINKYRKRIQTDIFPWSLPSVRSLDRISVDCMAILLLIWGEVIILNFHWYFIDIFIDFLFLLTFRSDIPSLPLWAIHFCIPILQAMEGGDEEYVQVSLFVWEIMCLLSWLMDWWIDWIGWIELIWLIHWLIMIFYWVDYGTWLIRIYVKSMVDTTSPTLDKFTSQSNSISIFSFTCCYNYFLLSFKGLNRVQSCPNVGREMGRILNRVRRNLRISLIWILLIWIG